MVEVSQGDPLEPLLSDKCSKRPSLRPLYIITFMQGIAFCIAMMPAFSLRFRELAAVDGLDVAATAASLGRLTAVRSTVEFVAGPVVVFWSDRVGRRPVLLMYSVALCLQFTILAFSQSLLPFSVSYIMFGLLSDSNGAIESTCIADATPTGSARAVAFGYFFTVVGGVLVIGPAIGGYLQEIDGRAPFVAASVLCLGCLAYMIFNLPEYHSKSSLGKSTSSRVSFLTVIKGTSPELGWYIIASGFSSMSIGVFMSVQVLWLRDAFGWDGQNVGRFISVYGILLIFAQSVLLPKLLKLMRGREALLVQFGFLIMAAKFVAYGLAPSGFWLYVTQICFAAGSCSVAPLRSLCTKSMPESHQGCLSGMISGLSTAAQVIGSLLGSHVFAMSLRGGMPLGHFLFVGAACYIAAAISVKYGAHIEKSRHPKRLEEDSDKALGA